MTAIHFSPADQAKLTTKTIANKRELVEQRKSSLSKKANSTPSWVKPVVYTALTVLGLAAVYFAAYINLAYSKQPFPHNSPPPKPEPGYPKSHPSPSPSAQAAPTPMPSPLPKPELSYPNSNPFGRANPSGTLLLSDKPENPWFDLDKKTLTRLIRGEPSGAPFLSKVFDQSNTNPFSSVGEASANNPKFGSALAIPLTSPQSTQAQTSNKLPAAFRGFTATPPREAMTATSTTPVQPFVTATSRAIQLVVPRQFQQIQTPKDKESVAKPVLVNLSEHSSCLSNSTLAIPLTSPQSTQAQTSNEFAGSIPGFHCDATSRSYECIKIADDSLAARSSWLSNTAVIQVASILMSLWAIPNSNPFGRANPSGTLLLSDKPENPWFDLDKKTLTRLIRGEPSGAPFLSKVFDQSNTNPFSSVGEASANNPKFGSALAIPLTSPQSTQAQTSNELPAAFRGFTATPPREAMTATSTTPVQPFVTATSRAIQLVVPRQFQQIQTPKDKESVAKPVLVNLSEHSSCLSNSTLAIPLTSPQSTQAQTSNEFAGSIPGFHCDATSRSYECIKIADDSLAARSSWLSNTAVIQVASILMSLWAIPSFHFRRPLLPTQMQHFSGNQLNLINRAAPRYIQEIIVRQFVKGTYNWIVRRIFQSNSYNSLGSLAASQPSHLGQNFGNPSFSSPPNPHNGVPSPGQGNHRSGSGMSNLDYSVSHSSSPSSSKLISSSAPAYSSLLPPPRTLHPDADDMLPAWESDSSLTHGDQSLSLPPLPTLTQTSSTSSSSSTNLSSLSASRVLLYTLDERLDERSRFISPTDSRFSSTNLASFGQVQMLSPNMGDHQRRFVVDNTQMSSPNPAIALRALFFLDQHFLPQRDHLSLSSDIEIQYQTSIDTLDSGGVTRDFITRLFRAICATTQNLLPMVRDIGEGFTLPTVNLDNGYLPLREQLSAYRLIGRLFASFMYNQPIPIGRHFHPVLYEMISTALRSLCNKVQVQVPDGENSLLSTVDRDTYIAIAHQYVRVAYPLLPFTPWDLITLYTTGACPAVSNALDQDFWPQHIHPVIRAVWAIAQSMYSEHQSQRRFQIERIINNPRAFEMRIAGLPPNGAAVIAAFRSILRNSSEQTYPHSVGFLYQWLQEANPNSIAEFLATLSGSETLPENSGLVITIDPSLRPNSIPVVSTCFRSITLPASYDNYARFKAMLEITMDHRNTFNRS